MLKHRFWYMIFSYNTFLTKIRNLILGLITINENTIGWKITLKIAIGI